MIIHWNCQECAACCKDNEVYLTELDIWRLFDCWSSELVTKDIVTIPKKTYKWRFNDQYVAIPNFLLNHNEKNHCPFLSDNRCKDYHNRPVACRIYPLLFSFHSGSLFFESGDCPAIRIEHKIKDEVVPSKIKASLNPINDILLFLTEEKIVFQQLHHLKELGGNSIKSFDSDSIITGVFEIEYRLLGNYGCKTPKEAISIVNNMINAYKNSQEYLKIKDTIEALFR